MFGLTFTRRRQVFALVAASMALVACSNADATPVSAEPSHTAPAATEPVYLMMDDMTAACRQEYGNDAAIAKVTPNPNERPSYWIKCYVDDVMIGDGHISLDAYCPSGRSYNNFRDAPESDEPWLMWQCERPNQPQPDPAGARPV